jgi:hypothetical protein
MKSRVKLKLTPIFWISLFVIALNGIGCRQDSSRVEIRNLSGQPITVKQVTNFKHDPACGSLAAGGISALNSPQQDFPDDFVIKWRIDGFGPNRNKKAETKVSIVKIPKSKRRGTLVLELNKKFAWSVRFEN